MLLEIGIGIAALFGLAGIAASDDEDDGSSYEEECARAERLAAEKEKERRKRASQERRRKASLAEAEQNLARVNGRHSSRISSAQAEVARSKAELDKFAAVAHDLDDVLK